MQTDEDWEADGSERSICDGYAVERCWRGKAESHVLPYSDDHSESD